MRLKENSHHSESRGTELASLHHRYTHSKRIRPLGTGFVLHGGRGPANWKALTTNAQTRMHNFQLHTGMQGNRTWAIAGMHITIFLSRCFYLPICTSASIRYSPTYKISILKNGCVKTPRYCAANFVRAFLTTLASKPMAR